MRFFVILFLSKSHYVFLLSLTLTLLWIIFAVLMWFIVSWADVPYKKPAGEIEKQREAQWFNCLVAVYSTACWPSPLPVSHAPSSWHEWAGVFLSCLVGEDTVENDSIESIWFSNRRNASAQLNLLKRPEKSYREFIPLSVTGGLPVNFGKSMENNLSGWILHNG